MLTEMPAQTEDKAAALRRAKEALQHVSAGNQAVLRATRDGVVSRVQRQPGDVVAAGEPLVRITGNRARRVTGFLMPEQGLAVMPGQRWLVAPLLPRPATPPAMAVVETIDPEVMDMIDPFNPVPRNPLRGRRVRLLVESPDNTLVPGESVLISDPDTSWRTRLRRIFSTPLPAVSRPIQPAGA